MAEKHQEGSEKIHNENILTDKDDIETPEAVELTLSDLVSVVHKSLIYSQHNIRFTELEELKKHYDVVVTNEISTYTHKNINLDGVDVNENTLTKQHSLTINDANIKIKVNLDKIIDRDEKKEVVISKYNESGTGISTELDINLNLDSNIVLA